jgi:hypothetical protein
VSTPAVAVQEEPPAFRIFGALAASWTRFREKDRAITVSVSASAAVHLALLIAVGTSMYDSGEDDRNIPELSVQLVTREGPSSEEYTEAALPKPAPEPVQPVVDDPGTAEQTIASDVLATTPPLTEQVPDVAPEETPQPQAHAQVETLEASGAVLTTTGTSGLSVPIVTEPRPEAPVTMVPQPEKVMITKNMTQVAQKLLDTNMTNSELTWSEAGHQYTARVLRQPAADSTGLEQVIAEIVTDRDGKRMKTRLSMKRLAFSHFTQLVNFWDPNIQLHDDVIDGRFHSNTEIGLAYSGGIAPRFFGKVTTSALSMTYGGYTSKRQNQEIFQGGVETRTERVTLPRDMPDVVSGGDSHDRRIFETDTRIIFNADGTYVWRAANGEGPLERADASEHPRYLIGDKGARLYVSGTVCGIFTVYSPTDIEIENDLVYAKDPRDTVISRDFLALISGRDIKVASPQITGVGDLHVHAAMFARRRFMIESVANGKPGTLYILGSLTAGTILETEPRYATKMDYDKRFEYLRPASFPMTRRYEVDSWDADWQEVEKTDGAPPPTQGLARSE